MQKPTDSSLSQIRSNRRWNVAQFQKEDFSCEKLIEDLTAQAFRQLESDIAKAKEKDSTNGPANSEANEKEKENSSPDNEKEKKKQISQQGTVQMANGKAFNAQVFCEMFQDTLNHLKTLRAQVDKDIAQMTLKTSSTEDNYKEHLSNFMEDLQV
ncbi:hypothetical protein RFI_18733, partial [Reticulomyxa filosa]